MVRFPFTIKKANMLVRIFFLLMLSLPQLSYAQNIKNWKLYINNKMALSAKEDSVLTIEVHDKDTSTLKFVFNAGDTAFIRRVIVMNSQRKGIDDSNMNEKGCEVTFNTQVLYHQSEGEDITFYLVNIPADPAKAALVRIAPHPFCNLKWLK